MTDYQIGEDYGKEYVGMYTARRLTWAEGRELFRHLAASKDSVAYIEDLMIASITGPIKLEKRSLQDLPMQLIRRLQDMALAENETTKSEAAFLSSSHSAAPLGCPKSLEQ